MVQAKTAEARSAIGNALGLLNKSQGGKNAGASKKGLLPTARTRRSLDLLMRSNPEKLLKDQVDLREVANDLFNWKDDGNNRVNKVVIRRMNTALNTPGKYSHAVELIAFMSAISPLFDADRLSTMFDLVDEVESSFAPARFTIQLSHLIDRIMSKYPTARVQRLCKSMWVDAHRGQWWNLIANADAEAAARAIADNGIEDDFDMEEAMEAFIEGKLHYSNPAVRFVSNLDDSPAVREAIKDYVDVLDGGVDPNPDMAILTSNIPWLKSDERPESPVGPLLESMINLLDLVQEIYKMPEKPAKFSDLYPPVQLYGGQSFPFPNIVRAMPEFSPSANMRFELVKNAIELDANRQYMGNCTGSYRGRMEDGVYMLYRIHHTLHNETSIYNASIMLSDNGARLGEINSRFNRGGVPQNVSDAVSKYIESLNKTNITPNHELIQYNKEMLRIAKAANEAMRRQGAA